MSQSSHDTNINLGKNIYQIVEITAFRAILAQRISILKGCLGCENTFTRTVSDCTLRLGFETLNSQICFCISSALRNALRAPEASSRAWSYSVW